MPSEKYKITGGLYLVIDPCLGLNFILPKILKAIEGGVDVLQIWNHWQPGQNKNKLIHAVCETAHSKNIPVLMNDEWKWLNTTALDGVHFDKIPFDIEDIRKSIKRPFLSGITCGNDLDRVQWAVEHNFDYISFCSMFPSSSAGACEIVEMKKVIQARQMTSMPVFLSGGITLSNIEQLIPTGMDGIALISGIMKSEDPKETSKTFKEKLYNTKIIKNETNVNQ